MPSLSALAMALSAPSKAHSSGRSGGLHHFDPASGSAAAKTRRAQEIICVKNWKGADFLTNGYRHGGRQMPLANNDAQVAVAKCEQGDAVGAIPEA